MNLRIARSLTRSVHLAFTLAAALSLACSGAPPGRSPVGCHTDVDCAVDAHCRAGSCVADVPPVAHVSGPSSALAHAELAFDGSGSSDEDDDIVAYAWSTKAVGNACAPEPGPTTEPAFHPVFPCAGEFEVTLVVRDRAGVESRPATLAVSVAAAQRLPPTVTAGSEVVVAHRCEGTPLTCGTVDPTGTSTVQLAAHARDQLGSEALTYRWEWIAPNPVDPAAPPQVRFVSGERGATPVVSITTPGSAIAGRWSFVVTVTDAHGLSARDTQSVVVQNRAPTVSGGEALALPHSYDAAAGRYRAAGTLTYAFADPDGDPVTPAWLFRARSPDHCTFGLAAGSASAFELSCADPAELIGAVSREVTLTVADANGASASATWTVDATNRPPVIAPVPAALSFRHSVDDPLAPTQFLVQGASPFTASDPDGDPLPPVRLTAQVDGALSAHSTGRVAPDALGAPRFSFVTPVGYPLEFRSGAGVSPFTVRGDVSDPWSAAAPVSFAVTVEDRAPLLVSAPGSMVLDHQYDGSAYVAGGPIGVFVDPDGDPLGATDAGGSAACTSVALERTPVGDRAWVSCRLPYLVSAGGTPPLAQFLSQRAAVLVRDPWGQGASTATSIQITNRAPTLGLGNGVLLVGATTACSVDALGYYLAMSYTPVDPLLVDPDGDPVQLTWAVFSASGGRPCAGISPTPHVCVPGSPSCIASVLTCNRRVDDDPIASLRASASDGVASTAATQATATTCAVPGPEDDPTQWRISLRR